MKKTQNLNCSGLKANNNNISGGGIKNMNNDKRRRSFYELFLSLIWCLVFLFYCEVCLSHGNEVNNNPANGSIGAHGERKLAIPNSSIPRKVTNITDGMLLEYNISINFTATQVRKKVMSDSSCLLSRQSVEQELVFYMLGYTNLECEVPAHFNWGTNKFGDKVHGLATHHAAYLNLEEFQNRTNQDEKIVAPSQRVNVTHRVELDGTEYNYASAAKGGKVVAHNKEAKGASTILGKDHDKYLINPCSVGGKFVIVELAEETLVDAVNIANFELHSSNFKDFELLGSLNYPTETWTHLGSFVASNVKHAQKFFLPEAKWVRYLNLSLISHYGSEHYCTLSLFEVYGVDAIERLLEDLIDASGESAAAQVSSKANSTVTASAKPEVKNIGKKKGEAQSGDSTVKGTEAVDDGQSVHVEPTQNTVVTGKIPEPVVEVRQKPNSRIPGDAVLKILMQKVRSMEVNLSSLEEYLKELNQRQSEIVPEIDKELARISSVLEDGRKQLKELVEWQDKMVSEIEDMESWKAGFAAQMEALATESRMLRSEVESVATNQASLETRELVLLVVNFFFLCIAFLKLLSKRVLASFGASRSRCQEVSQTSKGWMFVLISSSITMLVALLSI